jgi:hypothetical protein
LSSNVIIKQRMDMNIIIMYIYMQMLIILYRRVEHGNNRFKTTNNSESTTQEQLASQIGISVDTLHIII